MRSGALRSRLAAMISFAIAMGWLEAVVVVYIRALLGLAHSEGLPAEAEVMERIRSLPWLLATEQSREAATLAMLAAVAWLAARGWRARLGTLLTCFGTWDIAYYAALYALLRWPPGPGTYDLLFLIPPHRWWYQPVWVPVSISALMIAVGIGLLARESRRAG